MLYELSKLLRTELVTQGYPFEVGYGPEAVSAAAIARTRIIVERNRGTDEPFVAPKMPMTNPRCYYNKVMSGKIRIYANSTLAGARTQDHERLADLLADMVATAIYKIAKSRKIFVEVLSGKLLSSAELGYDSLQTWPGAVYDVAIRVACAVKDLTWDGAAKPEATVTAFGSHGSVTVGSSVAEDTCSTHNIGE